LHHKINYDADLDLYGDDAGEYYSPMRDESWALILNGKFVVSKLLTIDFRNYLSSTKGFITFYEQKSHAGLWYFYSYTPKEKYSLNLIKNNFVLNPNLTFKISKLKFIVGAGIGVSTILSRSGSLDRKYGLERSTNLYQFNMGLSQKLGKGIISLQFIRNWTSEMAVSNWKVYESSNSITVGYLLPVYLFKRKPKTATDPNS
jgi:hypothetical protein